MAIKRSAIILLIALAAAPALAARVLLQDDPTLTCMASVIKDGQGNDLKVASVSTLTQKRFDSVQSSVASQGEAACLRMQVKCADGRNPQHCTQADNDAKAWRWAYMLTVKPVCDYYKNVGVPSGYVKDVHCCTSNGCNLDKALDTTTKVLQLGARAEP